MGNAADDDLIGKTNDLIDSFFPEPVTEPHYNFGSVIEELRHGKNARRAKWKRGQVIFLVGGSEFEVQEGRPLATIYPVGRRLTYRQHLDIRLPDGTVGMWQPTHDDLLACDWVIS